MGKKKTESIFNDFKNVKVRKLFVTGAQAFGSDRGFLTWLLAANRKFRGQSPLEIIVKKREAGIEKILGEVEKMSQPIPLGLLKHGIKVFGSQENFLQWMHSSLVAFNWSTPYQAMVEKENGSLVVDQELGRIEHGVLA